MFQTLLVRAWYLLIFLDHDANEKLVKSRHYDTNEVRRYMAKQRSERRRKHQEQEDNKKKNEQSKNRMLEDLYKKQKASVAQTKSDGIQFKLDPPEIRHKVCRFNLHMVDTCIFIAAAMYFLKSILRFLPLLLFSYFLAPLCQVAAELFKCRLVRRRHFNNYFSDQIYR